MAEENSAENNTELAGLKDRQAVRSMARTLLITRNEAVSFRSSLNIERQWREDEMLFLGEDTTGPAKKTIADYAAGNAVSSKKPVNKSQVIINIVRPKCEIAWGRFCDILFPVDDRNWGLKVTPDPEVDEMLKNNEPAIQNNSPVTKKEDGQPATMRDVGQDKMSMAKERMEKMQTEIADQLEECDFNAECRKVAWDAIRIGTGVLKGPEVIKNVELSWKKITDQTGETFVAEQKEEKKPASKRVDPRNIYPSPECEELRKAQYIWEYGTILPRDLQKLIGVPGYEANEIKLVLEEEPKRLNLVAGKLQVDSVAKGMLYETWEYNGAVTREALSAAGCACDGDSPSLMASVLFINERPIKIVINPVEVVGDLPYDGFTWSHVDGSPWGVGLAQESKWPQRVITGAWRAMMDNAGDSAGANVVILDGLEPADDVLEVTGKKIWVATDEIDDVRKAFGQFQIQNNQNELEAIINLALRFLDQETSIPTLFNGEAKTAPETLGATNIMVNANNVSLRMRVKLWDDAITRPHLKRYYAWNMLYNEDESIKGDYNVDPRGISDLYEKDQRAQSLLQAFNLKGDPDIGPLVDWKKATRQFFNSMHLDIMKSPMEIKASESKQQAPAPPPDPRIQSAQLRGQFDIKKEEIRQDADLKELEFKAQEAAKERAHQEVIEKMKLNIKIMELSQAQNIAIDKIKSELALNAGKMNLQRELSASPGKGPQIVTPIAEPPQRAPDGRAFEE